MGVTASFLAHDPVIATEPLMLTMQQLKASAEARKRRHFSPTKVFFCHSCSAFSYDSDYRGSLLCPHPCCIRDNLRQLEEIPRSLVGSLRLRAIMVHLIDARTSNRQPMSFSSKAGVSTVDIVLGVQLVNIQPDVAIENPYCCICNEDLKCGTCDPNTSVMKLECGHSFHESCILPWFEAHRSCPYCRANVKHFTSIPAAVELFESFNEDQLRRKLNFAMRAKIFSVSQESGPSVTEHEVQGTVKCSESTTVRRGELSIRLHQLLIKSASGHADSTY